MCRAPAAIAIAPETSATATAKGVLRVVPSPSWPSALSPQQRTVPLATRAHTWRQPAATPTASPTPGTSVGTVSKPPDAFSPQHWTVRFPRTAQERYARAATAMASVIPDAATGVVTADVVPLPACPESLLPQHVTAPAARRAHVWSKPAATSTAPATPEMSTGAGSNASSPARSVATCPRRFPPQQRTAPSSTTAHACSCPALRRDAPDAPSTGAGSGRSAVVPSPSCPSALRPQQDASSGCSAYVCVPPAATARTAGGPTAHGLVGAVGELAVRVVAPRAEDAVPQPHQRVRAAGRNRRRIGEPLHRDDAARPFGRAVTELAAAPTDTDCTPVSSSRKPRAPGQQAIGPAARSAHAKFQPAVTATASRTSTSRTCTGYGEYQPTSVMPGRAHRRSYRPSTTPCRPRRRRTYRRTPR